MGSVEKLTLGNMGVAFGILSLCGTETEIHLGGHLPPPLIATYVLKNTIATLRIMECCHVNDLMPGYDCFLQAEWIPLLA